jgi:hypothetical protein
MGQETVYYDAGGVMVTSTRLETPGQMFAMANVTSVRAESRNSWGLAVLVMSIGVLIAFVASQSETGGTWLCSGLTFAAGLLIGLTGSSTTLYVATAGGEVKALRSGDRKRIEDVATAIKTAIIHRG